MKKIVIIAFLTMQTPLFAAIEVTVTNGTAGSNGHDAGILRLEIQNNGVTIREDSRIVRPGKKYSFPAAVAVNDDVLLNLEYNTMVYPESMFQKRAEHSYEITVYDITDDSRVIGSPFHHLSVEYADNSLVITEIAVMVNRSDRIMIDHVNLGGGRHPYSLIFPLPESFMNLVVGEGFQPGGTAIDNSRNVFYLSTGLFPGKNTFVYRYSLPAGEPGRAGRQVRYAKTLGYPTEHTLITLRSASGALEFTALKPAVTAAGDTANIKNYLLKNLAAGTDLEFTATGLDGQKTAPFFRLSRPQLIAAAIFLLVVSLLWFLPKIL